MEITRTCDMIYLNEDYKKNPKEYYKFVGKEICNDFSAIGGNHY